LLGGAIAATIGASVAGVELVLHDVIPGHQALNRLDGNCSAPAPPAAPRATGPSSSDQLQSVARHRAVGYTIAYPPGHGPGDPLPLVVVLHGYGADHANALSGVSLAQAAAMLVDGQPLAPMALVSVDGGNGYWHARPGDDPMGMVVDELIPLCQARGLGSSTLGIGVLGTSMGGYGALLLAERRPDLVRAVAAISPALWKTYSQAHDANAGAFTSAGDFAANDVIANAKALTPTPVRVASGESDPFRPGVKALVNALPPGAVVEIGNGCHDGPFFAFQQPPSLAFLAKHLGPVRS
jgi:enterochelin esterase-like enzyme